MLKEEKRNERVKASAMRLLKRVSVKRQHNIIATVAAMLDQQSFPRSAFPENCSPYDKEDLVLFMLYQGFDYPDAYRIREYVKTCIMIE